VGECVQREVVKARRRRRREREREKFIDNQERRTRDKVSFFTTVTSFMYAPREKKANVVKEVDWSRSEEEDEVRGR